MNRAAPNLPPEAGRIRDFVARLSRARMQAIVARRLASRGAPAVLVALALGIGWPSLGVWCVGLAALVAATDAALVAIRERRRLRVALLEVGAVGQPIGDLLLAWEEAKARGQAAAGMAAWLSELLDRQVAMVPVGAERAWLARGLGAFRYLVVLAAAWLLFWLLEPHDPMPWYGLGGNADVLSGGNGRGESGGDSGTADRAEARAKRPSDSERDAPDPTQEPDPPSQPEGPPPSPDEPAPFLELPSQAHVVVPEFVRDGPTRRAMAEQAEIGGDAEGGAGSQQKPAGGGGASPSDRPQPTRETYERAAERALASRRVPERERRMVRAFFDALREGGK